MSRFDDDDERFRRELRMRMNATVVITTILSFFISFAIIMAMTSEPKCTTQPCATSQNGQQ